MVIHGLGLRWLLQRSLLLHRTNNRLSIWQIDQNLVCASHCGLVRIPDLAGIAANGRFAAAPDSRRSCDQHCPGRLPDLNCPGVDGDSDSWKGSEHAKTPQVPT